MINARSLAIVACGIVWLTPGIDGQSLSQYRNFALGSTVASVSALAGVDPAEAKTLHQRPAVLQDLEWRPSRWVAGSTASSVDPVEQILFSFYNDQLFRVVVDYGHERTESMTRCSLSPQRATTDPDSVSSCDAARPATPDDRGRGAPYTEEIPSIMSAPVMPSVRS